MNEATPIPSTISLGESIGQCLQLLWSSTKAFFLGIILSTVLQIIPILPARKRSTGNILNRLFASMLFGPLSLVLIAAFPLLLIQGWRTMVGKFCSAMVAWYDKTDLAVGFGY